ncbi:amino acid ABC transporter ATP-binding protein [Ligilactobacillus apodemi]|uniref:Polar amino acid ABC transporter ATP-binding protein n=1 Tax=Ligilactobacillus apodemi DSM 16634 = JCM 16172 TaxID=1423724 RepID=A0A0R1TTF0_9LACO|nr:amino acid ABC transporter ATP-binding protein [Ligilactobacillus apodemi]KRL84158.1 polar amino acid ABC transporter ATP-binding protein [Ligilactobacillus apodemi DSM 16634 = JCM 16172]MBD5069384.1 amino acid ABC transporter ATP-binding protein [Lactobacillus sp.]MCR1901201.1 amino acid ABC transporter ATP-binding protein [Ligilactobacillus apodemi]
MLELQQITKKFGERTILDHVDLTIEDGKILCIVGQSGGGKTTLLRCISGLEQIDSGKILVNGKEFDPYVNSNNEAVIGVVFQEYNLFPHLTVLENVMLAPQMVLKKDKETATREANELLKKLALGDKGNLYPWQLSGGQKQRVAIARALAMKPQILCYDEPTSALDPGLRDTVKEIILDLKKEKMTQIIVTHDIEFAKEIADDILKVKPLSN